MFNKREYDKKWRKENKEYYKNYNKNYMKIWRKKNRKKYNENQKKYGKNYYSKYKEKILKRTKKYHKSEKYKLYKKSDLYKLKVLKSRLKCSYGITVEDFNNLFQKQNGVCFICREKQVGRRLSIDHDHKTGKIRGLLCSKCNRGLGLFNDNINKLKNAINYLGKY